jgi:hypothetical protein
MARNEFSFETVGERFDNEEGASRQAELRRCAPGDHVEVLREPSDTHDP